MTEPTLALDPAAVETLRKNKLCEGLSDAQLHEVAGWFIRVDFLAERDVLAAGSDPTGVYVLVKGSVEVFTRSTAGDQPLATVAAPSVFGEMALLSGVSRSAFVKTKSAVETGYLSRTKFEALLAQNNVPALRLAANAGRIAAQRFSELMQKLVGSRDELFAVEHDRDAGMKKMHRMMNDVLKYF